MTIKEDKYGKYYLQQGSEHETYYTKWEAEAAERALHKKNLDNFILPHVESNTTSNSQVESNTTSNSQNDEPIFIPFLIKTLVFYSPFIVALWLVSIPAFRSWVLMTTTFTTDFPVSRICIFILNLINHVVTFPINALTLYFGVNDFSLIFYSFLYISLLAVLIRKMWPKMKKVFIVFALFYIGIGYVPIIHNWQLKTPGEVYVMTCSLMGTGSKQC